MEEHKTEFQPPVDLPKPQSERIDGGLEAGTAQPGGETSQAQSLERGISAPAPAGPSQTTVPQDPAGAVNAADVNSNSYGPVPASTPPIADDADLIEKEWVHKAKQIVEQTKTDPYNQNKQMNRVKADYLKKRYNKDVKLADD